MADPCQGPDCDRNAERDGLCRGHRQQRYDGKELTPLRAYRQDPWERIFEAFLSLLDADPEDDAEYSRRRKHARDVLRISRLTAKPRIPKATLDAIRAARHNGETMRAVAERFGVSAPTVLRVTSVKVSGDNHA